MDLTSESVLGPRGAIARRLSTYESRPEQVEMAAAVQAAIAGRSHLLVEAGTGVGKSFAYLVPAILAAGTGAGAGADGKSRKIVVSTHTISLQEQLIARDLPFLNAVLPVEFSAVLAKGRANYVSLRRLRSAAERSKNLFAGGEELQQLSALRRWSAETTDGSLSDLDFRPVGTVWDEARSEQGNCLGRNCPTYDDCFFYKARRRVWNADIIVVNHALFFADLALRREGASVLPDYDVVILDEAHTLEQVAGDHLGISLTSGQFNYALGKLFNERQQKGLLVHHHLPGARETVVRLRYLAEDFFASVQAWQSRQPGGNGRLREPLAIENPLGPELRKLSGDLRARATSLKGADEQLDLTSAADRLDGLSASLTCWLGQTLADAAYWVEVTGRQQNVRLVCAPIEVGGILRDELFSQVKTAILTSATLTVGRRDFSYIRERLGLTACTELKLGSPFNFGEQMQLVLADNMPDPSESPKAYEQAVCERIRHHIDRIEGGTFVLFTSYRMLKNCTDQLAAWFTSRNRMLLCQGEGQDRSALLEKFRQDGRAVLFGTESFWQGVDVPGDALQNVMITKLPFSVPDHPLLEARLERIRERGGNPFMDYQVPEAAIKLRQGFGRLIRSRSDTGQVVILDPRIRTKRYGKLFLESLPECRRVLDRGPAAATRHDPD